MKQAIKAVWRNALDPASRPLDKNRRARRWGRGLIWIALCALLLYVLLVVFADAIVDSIYANVNPDEIREMPPSVAEIRTVPGQQQILGGRPSLAHVVTRALMAAERVLA